MTQSQPDDAVRTENVYLLFAHEPYCPGPGAQEINTTLVAAASLLHPRVRQPDGAQIHDRLTQGRQWGEIVPLATLTHELGGADGWLPVGDWESVTADLLQLVRAGECDALSLGLPEIASALICTGPHSQVRAFDAAAEEFIAYGPAERAAVLAEVDTFLASLVAAQDLWPGDGLLPSLNRPASHHRPPARDAVTSRDDRAKEHEELAVEAIRRSSQVSSTDPSEHDACVRHYQQRATFHADTARALRHPTP